MIEVSLPDGTIIEFPDGTSKGVIDRVSQDTWVKLHPQNSANASSFVQSEAESRQEPGGIHAQSIATIFIFGAIVCSLWILSNRRAKMAAIEDSPPHKPPPSRMVDRLFHILYSICGLWSAGPLLAAFHLWPALQPVSERDAALLAAIGITPGLVVVAASYIFRGFIFNSRN